MGADDVAVVRRWGRHDVLVRAACSISSSVWCCFGVLRRGAGFRFAAQDVLFAMGRANYQEKPFVDEVIPAILGAAVRLLC